MGLFSTRYHLDIGIKLNMQPNLIWLAFGWILTSWRRVHGIFLLCYHRPKCWDVGVTKEKWIDVRKIDTVFSKIEYSLPVLWSAYIYWLVYLFTLIWGSYITLQVSGKNRGNHNDYHMVFVLNRTMRIDVFMF